MADHSTIFAPYLATADSFTLDGIGRGDPEETACMSSCMSVRLHSNFLCISMARPMAEGRPGDDGPQVRLVQTRCCALLTFKPAAAWTAVSNGGPANQSSKSSALSSSSAGKSTSLTNPTSPSSSSALCRCQPSPASKSFYQLLNVWQVHRRPDLGAVAQILLHGLLPSVPEGHGTRAHQVRRRRRRRARFRDGVLQSVRRLPCLVLQCTLINNLT